MEGCAKCCMASNVTVLPHEVPILKELAEELGVEARFEPSYMFFDRVSGMRIAVSYLMQLSDGKCPFLFGTRCAIHDRYKPLTCRAYPYLPRVIKYYLDYANKRILMEVRFTMSLLCPVTKSHYEYLGDAMNSIRVAVRYAPREADAALEMALIRRIYVDALSELWRNGLVELDEASVAPHAPIVDAFSFIRRFRSEFSIALIEKLARARLAEFKRELSVYIDAEYG